MPFMTFLKDGATVSDIIMGNLDRYGPLLSTFDHVMTHESELSRGERELIAAYVSSLNQCEFCYGSHKVFAEAQGMDAALFEDLMTDIDRSRIDEKLKTLLHYVKKLTLTPSRVAQADADAVTSAGWSEKTLSDAIAVCGLFCLINRVVDGHGIEAQPIEDSRTAAEMVKQHGYSMDAVPNGEA